MAKVQVTFQVHARCAIDESVFVVGNLPEFGSWHASQAIRLRYNKPKERRNSAQQPQQQGEAASEQELKFWVCQVDALTAPAGNASPVIAYRYFIGARLLDRNQKEHIVVRYAEEDQPRQIVLHAKQTKFVVDDTFGQAAAAAASQQSPKLFRIRRGALSCEQEIHVRAYRDAFRLIPSEFLTKKFIDPTNLHCRIACRMLNPPDWLAPLIAARPREQGGSRTALIEAYRYADREHSHTEVKVPEYSSQHALNLLPLQLDSRRDFAVYRITTLNWQDCELEIQLFDAADRERLIGSAIILPEEQMSDMAGMVKVPILASRQLMKKLFGKNSPSKTASSDSAGQKDGPLLVGILKLYYTIILPINLHAADDSDAAAKNQLVNFDSKLNVDNMQHIYSGYFGRLSKPIRIGHRGAGCSYSHSAATNAGAPPAAVVVVDNKKADISNNATILSPPAPTAAATTALHRQNSNIRENTLASFIAAFDKGADMIEFDVQLSRDAVPVIYHDFFCRIKPESAPAAYYAVHNVDINSGRMTPTPVNTLEVQINHLSYEQMTHWKIYDSSEVGGVSVLHGVDENAKMRPFPTLREVLQNVPEQLAFDVEVKYPQALAVNGALESLNAMERNRYCDAILRVLLDCSNSNNSGGADRRIILSCFDADVLAMLRAKQSIYPVVFLTYNLTGAVDDYLDRRTKYMDNNFRVAKLYDLFGLAMHTEDALRYANFQERHRVAASYDEAAKGKGTKAAPQDKVTTGDEERPDFAIDMVHFADKMGDMLLLCWGAANQDTSVIQKLLKAGIQGVCYDRLNEIDVSGLFVDAASGKPMPSPATTTTAEQKRQ